MQNQTVLIIENSNQGDSRSKQLLQDAASASFRLLTQSWDNSIAALGQSQSIDGIVIDGIVLDIDIDPLRALSQMRQQMGQFCPPIVVVGDDTVETAVQLLKAGAADYLVRERLTAERLCLALQSAIATPTDIPTDTPTETPTETLTETDEQKPPEATLLDQLARHQQTEQALQAANQRISCILESMTDAFVALDRNWRITYINQTAARINQVAPDVLIGQSHWTVWSDTRDELEERYQYAIATQTPLHFDYFYKVRQRWYEIHAYPLADGLGLFFRDIHERKQAEEALRKAEERLRVALQNAPVTVFNQDCDLKYTWIYKPALYKPDDVVGKCDRDFLPADDAAIIVAIKQQVLDTGVGARQEVKVTQHGINHYFDLTVEPLRDDQNRVIGITGASVDISAVKRTATELRKNEERLRLAVEGAQMATWDVDLVTGQAIWSDLHFTVLGYEPTPTGEASSAMWSQCIHPDDRERVSQEWQQSRQEHRSFRAEYRVIRADNDQMSWLEGLGNFIYDDNGEAIRSSGVLFDISDRKQTEAALQESEDRFRTLADNISQFAWMADASGWICWYNQRWFDYTGTTLEEMQGWGWQQVHHPDHVDRVVESFRCSIQTGQPWEDVFPLRGKDGNYRWFLSRALPIRDEAGSILRWFGTNTDITKRKQAEDALAQREAELRLVTDTVPALISFVDAEQRFRFNNNRYEDWFGQPTTEMYGKHIREVLGEATYNKIRPKVRQVLAGQEVSYELQFVNKDGEIRYVSATYMPRFSSQGTVEGFVALISDISDRKQAEAALRQSEDRLRMALESAQLGTWDWNLSTNELLWDDCCKQMFGLSPDAETSIETFFAGLHPDDRDRVEQIVQRSLDPANDGNYEAEFRTIGLQDGIERWVLAKGQAYFDADGTSRRFIGTVFNITDRKQVEAALRDSEIRFRQMTDVAPMLVWISDTDTLCSYFNQSWLTFTGRTLEQEMGNGWTEGIHPDDFKYCLDVYNNAFDARRPFEMEYRLRRFDGEYRWILDVGVPRFTPDGEFLGYIGSCFDIHDRKQAENEREELLQREQAAREAAERANRVKDEFLTVLSHELRSPLNPILGWAKLLQRRKFDAAETAQALATIERNAKLQTQLIDDLLDVARILRGKLKLNQVPLNLANVVASAIETMRKTAEAKSITLNVDVADVGQVYGDNTRLQQVLWNLLSNAIKFTPSEGQVDLQLQRIGDQAQIMVRDTGKGIKPDFLNHIFESFRQEDASTTRQYGGLGLGLAIVRYLVNAHGGTITADSAGEGLGATFTVRLPLLKTESVVQQPDAWLLQADVDLAGMRILVVDDEPDASELVETLLIQYGAEVKAVSSATEALSALAVFQPELLVSDIGMPEMDGYDLIRQIRALPVDQGGHLPAIALTAYAREVDYQQALASGYQQHIAKPVNLEQLLQAILSLAQSRLKVVD
ncbi:MAG: PAS domain S-box protein [Thainema sp.]